MLSILQAEAPAAGGRWLLTHPAHRDRLAPHLQEKGRFKGCSHQPGRPGGAGCPGLATHIQGACVQLCPRVQSQPHFCSEQPALPDTCNTRS